MKHGIALLLQILLLGINTQKDGGGAGKEKKKKNSRPGSGLTCPRELITLMISIHSHDKNNDSAQQ